MTVLEIARQRLTNQRIAQAKFNQPGEVVTWLGAMQAQDYASAKWAVGTRYRDSTDTDIEKAIVERKILRTWLLRGLFILFHPTISIGC